MARAGPSARVRCSANPGLGTACGPDAASTRYLLGDEACITSGHALLLPGGHRARGMRSYIDSDPLQRLVVEAFTRGLIVAAICHGALLAARSIDPATGRSVLYGRKTTALTWALERRAWHLTRIT